MAFIPHTLNEGGHPPFEYKAAGAITVKVGTALTFASGKLAIAAGANAPAYFALVNKTCTAGEVIPVQKVKKGVDYETVPASEVTLTDANVGSRVTIGADGGSITATTTGGVALIVSVGDGKAVVRF